MNICSYIPTKYLDNKDYNDRFRLLFKEVCFLKAQGIPGAGTVTSVSGLSPLFTVANATTTPTFSRVSQNQNLVYASPNGSSGVPTFRALVAADLPNGGDIPISSLALAGASNIIDNSNYLQQWQWNSLTAGNVGLSLGTQSTTSTGSEKVLEISSTGQNSVDAITTYSLAVSNSHSPSEGNTATNIAFRSQAANGTTNIAGWFNRGKVIFGTIGTENGVLEINGATSGTISIKPQNVAGTYNFNLPVTAGNAGDLFTSGGGGGAAMTWTDPADFATPADIAALNLASGTYTPTAASEVNCTIDVVSDAQYMRVGSVVTVSGLVRVSPTGAGATSFTITLPIASSFSDDAQLAGSSNSGDIANYAAKIKGVVGDNVAQLEFYATSADIPRFYYHYTYQII